jgi:hypothetical protein
MVQAVTGASCRARPQRTCPLRPIGQRLTATVTATAAANRSQQRPATAHNARTIGANWGYVRPEKQTVEDQCLGATGDEQPSDVPARLDNEQ